VVGIEVKATANSAPRSASTSSPRRRSKEQHERGLREDDVRDRHASPLSMIRAARAANRGGSPVK